MFVLPMLFMGIFCANTAFDCCNELKLKKSDISFEGRVENLFYYLSNTFNFPISFETDSFYCGHPRRGVGDCDGLEYISISGKNMSLYEALEIATRALSNRYTWELWNCSIINVFPWRVHDMSDYFMNIVIPHFKGFEGNLEEFRNITNELILKKAYRIRNFTRIVSVTSFSYELVKEALDKTRSKFKRKIIINEQRNVTIRNLLNMVARSLGRQWRWEYTKQYILDKEKNQSSFCYNLTFYDDINFIPLEAKTNMIAGKHPKENFQYCSPNRLMRILECDCEDDTKKQVHIVNETIDYVIIRLNQIYKIPVNFESVLWRKKEIDKTISNMTRININGEYTISEVLNEIIRQDDRYIWSCWNCLAYNVFPKNESHDPYYIMNLPVNNFDISGKDINESLEELSAILERRHRLLTIRRSGEKELDLKDYTDYLQVDQRSLMFSGDTVREVLNELFSKPAGGFSWQYHRWVVVPEKEDRERWWCGLEAHSELIPVPLGEIK